MKKTFYKNYISKNKIKGGVLNYEQFKEIFSYLEIRNEDIDYLLFYLYKKTENIDKLIIKEIIQI